MKLKTDKILITVIALLLLAVTVIIVVSFYQSRQLNDTAKRVVHTQELLIQAEKLLSLISAHEAGSRGYVLTGKKSFLSPLEVSQKTINDECLRLKALTKDNPVQQSRADSLLFYIDKKLNFSKNTIAVLEQNGAAAAAALIETEEGKKYTDQIRRIVDQVQATGNELLVMQKESNEKKSKGLNAILLSVVVSIFLIVFFFIQNIRLDFNERKKAAAALEELNNGLEQKVKERTASINLSEKKYRYLFESNPMPMWVMDLATFKFLDVNKTAVLNYGFSREEFLSMTALDIRPAADHDLFKQSDHTSEVNADNYNKGIWKHHKKDGTIIQVEVIAHPIIFEGVPARLILANNITARVIAEQKLFESEKRFKALVENNEGIISLVDEKLNVLFRSASASRITGWSNSEFEEGNAARYIHPDDLEATSAALAKTVAAPGKNFNLSIRVMHKEGHYIWLEGILKCMLHDPAVRGIITNLQDVTERKKAEEKLFKANRLYLFISQVNQMIVRATDQTALFRDACQIAVEHGKFRMAWIGIIDEKTNQVIPAAQAGEDMEYIARIKPISMAVIPEACDPVGSALKEGKYIICNDIESDPQMAPWNETALNAGYLSSMTLPIIVSGKVSGAFSFYASEKNFFDAGEIALLEEATCDVGFALEIFKKDALRKKAELAVLESERRYQTLAEISPVGIFHTDETGYTTYVNPCWCKISGLSYDQGIGNGWLNAVHAADKKLLAARWELATKARAESVSEYRFMHADGSIAWVMGQAIPERKPDGQIIGYVGTITDITERKKAEEAIWREKVLSDKIINSLPGIFYLSDSTPKLLRWNQALETISGYTKEEIEKMNPALLFDPEDHPVLRAGIAKSQKEGKADVEIRLLTKTGQRIPFYFTGVGVEYNGQPAVMGIGIDASEHKKAEEEIKRVNQRFETIARATNDAVFEMDKLKDESWYNNAFLQLFKESDADENFKPDVPAWRSKIHPDDKERVIEKLETAYAGDTTVWSDEFRFQKADGSYGTYYDRAYLTRDESGKVIREVGSMTDITELKKAEESLKVANHRFELLAKATNDVIWDWDLTTNKLWWNNSYYNVFGVDSNSPLDINCWSKSVHPDDKKRVLNGLYKLIDSGENYWEDEYRCIKTNGDILFIYDRGFVLRNDQGKAYRMIGSMLDFTERKNAGEAIRASEEQYRTLVEQASDAIFIANAEGMIITVNTSACKLSQYTELQLLQMSIYDFAMMEDLQKNPFHFDELNQGKTVITERVMKGKDELVLNIEITAKQLSDRRLLIFVRDISGRIKAQNEIIREKNLSDSIINSLPGVFYLYNSDRKFLRWNKNFETVTMYTAGEIEKMSPLDFYDNDEKEMIDQKITSTFIHGTENVQADFLLKTKEKVPYYFTGISIEYEGSLCLMGVGIDFTERIRAQEEIKQNSEKLRQLTAHLQNIREEERKRIGREIHDELGQQLTAIKMDVAWVNKKIPEENTELKDKVKNMIQLLDGSNQSIRRILSELRPTILDDYGLVEAVEWLGQQFTQNTGIPVKFSSSDTQVKLPEQIATCIFRVYQEALTNITRYAHADKVSTSLTMSDESIIFHVEDNGQGFDGAAIQSKKSFGILGMKERVHLLGGSFELISTPGIGTSITINIPLTSKS